MATRIGLIGLAVVGLAGVAVGVGQAMLQRADATVEIEIRYSEFRPATITVPAGVPIRFVLINGDPIDHEWIVGDDATHERHRTGTEASHAERPTEQSVPAGEVVETSVTFESAGTFRFICHLPGHEAYGMVGRVIVTGG